MTQEFEKVSDETHYERHLNSILQALNNNEYVPWHRPWKVGQNAVANLASGRAYTGLSNIMVLSFSPFESKWWITENKIEEFCGKIKEGEEDKFQYVFYWHAHKYNHFDEEKNERRMGTTFYPRTHKVWNVEQTEGIVHHRLVQKEETFVHEDRPEVIEVIENYCSNKGPILRYEGDRAFYTPKTDSIQVPVKEQFENYEHFVATTMHELSHSTGHGTRLNRRGIEDCNAADRDIYGKEELIAEMSACYLMTTFGFTEEEIKRVTDNSVAYLKSWGKVIEQNPKEFIVAGRQAEKAAHLILNPPGM